MNSLGPGICRVIRGCNDQASGRVSTHMGSSLN